MKLRVIELIAHELIDLPARLAGRMIEPKSHLREKTKKTQADILAQRASNFNYSMTQRDGMVRWTER